MGQRLSTLSTRRLEEREPGDQVEHAKSPDFWGCEAQVVTCREPQNCVAGDAVVIEPVSSAIPCKQGIFQGIPEIPLQKLSPTLKKSLCCSDFLHISLRQLSGKYFLIIGNPGAANRESGHSASFQGRLEKSTGDPSQPPGGRRCVRIRPE